MKAEGKFTQPDDLEYTMTIKADMSWWREVRDKIYDSDIPTHYGACGNLYDSIGKIISKAEETYGYETREEA